MITYLELLQRTAEQKQPKKVVYNDVEYEWHNFYQSYTRDPIGNEKYETDILFLSDVIVDEKVDMDLATKRVIEVI